MYITFGAKQAHKDKLAFKVVSQALKAVNDHSPETMAMSMLSRKAAFATVRPAGFSSKRSVTVRASMEPQQTPAESETEAPINGVAVAQPVAVPVVAAPAAPSLFGEHNTLMYCAQAASCRFLQVVLCVARTA